MTYCIAYQCTLPITELSAKNTQEKAKEIFERSCKYFDLPEHIIISKSRERQIVQCRQMAMTALERNTKLTLREIGKMFDNRHYATVIHSKNTVSDLCDSDPDYKKNYNEYLKYVL